MTAHFKQHHETRVFADFSDWAGWWPNNRWALDEEFIGSLASEVRERGLVDPLLGPVPVSDVEFKGANYREDIWAKALNGRMRAILAVVLDACGERTDSIRIYCPEALNGLGKRLRERFRGFRGSEFVPDDSAWEWLRKNYSADSLVGLEHQNILDLRFPDSSFDIYAMSDVLEHVEDLDLALREAYRVLAKGEGKLIANFPFLFMDQDSRVCARMRDGKIVSDGPLEYHLNVLAPDLKSLVYELPGWDLLKRCRLAGFRKSEFVFISSSRMGIFNNRVAGEFVLVSST